MKLKQLFYYLGFTAFAISSIFFYSCEKKQVEIGNLDSQTEQSFKDAQLEGKIINFIDNVKLIHDNPSLKLATESMDIENAIWFIEAGSNLTYGNANSNLKEFVTHSSNIEIPIVKNKFLWADVQHAYDKVINTLESQLSTTKTTEKQVIFMDVELLRSTNDIAYLEINSVIGVNGPSVNWNQYPWYWGWELGRCDGTGFGVGLDAADKIAQLANYTIGVPSGNSYYTDVSYTWVCYWDVETNNNPYGEYLLFHDYQECSLNHACLSTSEISYYRNALKTIGNMYKPSGKSIIRYYLWDDTAFGLNNGCDTWDMAHFAKIKYAIWHTSSNPPLED